MKLDDLLQEIFTTAYNEAKTLKHEYITPEHILYASLFFNTGKDIIKYCGGNVDKLKEDLHNYFHKYMLSVENKEPSETLGLQNTISRAANHVMAAGKDIIKYGDILVAIYDEEKFFASYFLKKQGITRLDILNSITCEMYLEEDETKDSIESLEDEIVFEEKATSLIEDEKNKEDILSSYTVELTKKAKMGEFDPLVGRCDILDRTIQVLCRRTKNNPIHVGEAGVGKTAIVQGLARLIAEDNVPFELKGNKIYSLDMTSLLAGAKYRGDFEERVKKVLKKIKDDGKAIVYIDEIHTIVGAGSVSGSAMDASNMLKPFLTQGKLKFIGSTTYEEYKKYFEQDRALIRRFQKIDVPEPSKEDAYKILNGLKSAYEKFHKVKYTKEAIKYAVDLSCKYINDRFLPDKAIDVIDEAGAYIKLKNKDNVSNIVIEKKDIEKIISSMAKIPQESISVDDMEKLKKLDKVLKEKIYGQDDAIDVVVNAIKTSRAGFNEDEKPIASLLFVGPTGVGKTELSKQISIKMGIPLIRFDMSEYQEKHTVARLIGAPPGYVGYEKGGLLVDAIRKTPHCVLLLDEIEKVHPDVLNLLLQIMDYAKITDNNGIKADFKNVILIMTSNAGSRDVGKNMLGFGTRDIGEESIVKGVERIFSPEFRNRLDNIVVFNKINEKIAIKIAQKAILKFQEKLSKKNVKLTVTEKCLKWIAQKGFSKFYGAREIIRVVNKKIKPYFVERVLFGELSNGGEAVLDIKEGELEIKVKH